MANVMDYIRWRGDITIDERPFNIIDNLVFSIISYIDFKDVVPEWNGKFNSEFVTLDKAWEMIHEMGIFEKRYLLDLDETFLQELAKSKRFGKIKLSNYVDRYDEKQTIQFSAITFTLEDDSKFLAFRGTDQTILGWREDFDMGYKSVPAQKEATDYVNSIVLEDDEVYRLGGHSKGGNLAVYSAMMCSKECKKRITRVYDNDGPGFTNNLFENEDYPLVIDKILRIVPEYSIFGQLYEHDGKTVIVKSNNKGILQHDANSWQIENSDFVYSDKLDEKCIIINNTIKEWLNEVSPDEREQFVGEMFDALKASGVKDINDIPSQGIGAFEAIISQVIHSHEASKNMAKKLVKTGISQIKERTSVKKIVMEKNMFRGVIFTLFGLFFSLLPESSLLIIVCSSTLVIELFCFFKILFYIRKKDLSSDDKGRIIIYGLILLGVGFVAIFTDTMTTTANLLLGLLFVLHGVLHLISLSTVTEKKQGFWWVRWSEAVISIGLGAFFWMTRNEDLSIYVFFAGIFIALKGIYEIVYLIYNRSVLKTKK